MSVFHQLSDGNSGSGAGGAAPSAGTIAVHCCAEATGIVAATATMASAIRTARNCIGILGGSCSIYDNSIATSAYCAAADARLSARTNAIALDCTRRSGSRGARRVRSAGGAGTRVAHGEIACVVLPDMHARKAGALEHRDELRRRVLVRILGVDPLADAKDPRDAVDRHRLCVDRREVH